MSRVKFAHIGDDDSPEVFPISKSNFITFQDRIDKFFDNISDTLKQLLTIMSILEIHSCPPRDHKIRYSQKDTHIFVMKIDLSYFNGHLKIEEQGNRSVSDYAEEFYHLSSRIDLTKSESYMILRFKGVIRWEIEDKIALQLFFKPNDIIMTVEHAEALLEKGKIRIQNLEVRIQLFN
ncbi:unnamed protein product [Spirodela intermedia]|uniref:Uncharacterized protein n=1 Tax=Spirodela intermedia TaxID=51605 RepID=A0A7I8IJL2_SPIIN|nr:unnamed protein product [Spirodela intermedia]CAA6658028.1 unnamed protein product [Spirodela intermedia]